MDMGYYTKSAQEIFSSSMNSAMNPKGVDLRESRDSTEHPRSLAIVLALDVTGSMGSIPHHLVRDGLPEVMATILKGGAPDSQVLFMGIGDHECDSAPLQIGQFESSDELLDKWLTDLWLEGGGGGNNGESYMLAWMFAGRHTSIDCWEKRKQKGFLFTVGDEPCLPSLSANAIKNIMGAAEASTISSAELLDKAREMYNVYHLHLLEGSNGKRADVQNGWKELMGDNVVFVENHRKIHEVIAQIVNDNQPQEEAVAVAADETVEAPESADTSSSDVDML
jgi:hypothetical protein